MENLYGSEQYIFDVSGWWIREIMGLIHSGNFFCYSTEMHKQLVKHQSLAHSCLTDSFHPQRRQGLEMTLVKFYGKEEDGKEEDKEEEDGTKP